MSEAIGALGAKPFAIVTGGTRGLGRELSLAFARGGAQVLAVYRADQAAAEALRKQAQAEGLAIECFQHDVREAWTLAPPVGRPVILINNATSAFAPKPFHLTSTDELEALWTSNVEGPFRLAQALLRPMAQAPGSAIVNVLTTAILGGALPRGMAAYASAKLALQGLTQSLGAEYRPRGIRVFAVAPPFMDTPLTQAWDAALRKGIAESGQADPALVAACIVKLTQDAAVAGAGETYLVPFSGAPTPVKPGAGSN